MRLRSFAISNYARLQDACIEVREHLFLVGPTDVGKSSVLRCLDLLLGASTAQLYGRLTAADLRNPDEPAGRSGRPAARVFEPPALGVNCQVSMVAAAVRIASIVSWGWETIETWDAATSVTVARARVAMRRWVSGGMIRSSVPITVQLGSVFRPTSWSRWCSRSG